MEEQDEIIYILLYLNYYKNKNNNWAKTKYNLYSTIFKLLPYCSKYKDKNIKIYILLYLNYYLKSKIYKKVGDKNLYSTIFKLLLVSCLFKLLWFLFIFYYI